MTEFKTISEVSVQLGLPQHVLRFWESEFVQIKPTKRKGGRRYYSQKDVELLEKIQNLLYVKGYTIKGAKKALNQHFVPINISNDDDMKKAKKQDDKQIDIFEVINRPTSEEKLALTKVLETLKEMEKLLREAS